MIGPQQVMGVACREGMQAEASASGNCGSLRNEWNQYKVEKVLQCQNEHMSYKLVNVFFKKENKNKPQINGSSSGTGTDIREGISFHFVSFFKWP